ncbi:MAG: hypothetical protein B7X99_12160 [Rhizobiales bacterium 17-65-6]|nr:MAG: hypothetical protein B7Z30_00595 [Rhizobiales bacterium 12-68-15]OYZ98255.1 MAG: hypothetical protein B7X99_12160 [Rhizobiales bacterium 17-65-6]
MPRTRGRFTQDDVKRVLRAVRDLGMGARVDLVNGVIDVFPKPLDMPAGQGAKPVAPIEDFRM